MEEMSKHGQIGQAAMKADMDRKTARKYVAAGKLPSELKQPRDWRTRPDPFEEHWPEVEAQLRVTPEFEAKTLFELLQQQHPGRYEDGQLRTLQRHVKRWRAAHGPEREVVLAQQHRPGEATHKIPEGQAEHVEGNQRAFNTEYVALMRHLGMTPRLIELGEKEQNGDVEASNGAIKRRLEQALLVRGSRDFEGVDAWQAFVDETLRKANANRGRRVAEDLAAMRELDVAKLPEHVEEEVQVSEWSTVRVKHCAYSVPSRLIGEWVRVRIFEDRLEVRFADELQLACERLRGRGLHRIDYRHVIWSLVRKPGGFARYVYREEMFPSLVFREAYDAIQAAQPGTRGDLAYLRILHLAASTMESDVAAALAQLQTAGTPITVDAVKALTTPAAAVAVPALAAMPVDLTEYDALLDAQEAA